jgi:hypothetical protein
MRCRRLGAALPLVIRFSLREGERGPAFVRVQTSPHIGMRFRSGSLRVEKRGDVESAVQADMRNLLANTQFRSPQRVADTGQATGSEDCCRPGRAAWRGKACDPRPRLTTACNLGSRLARIVGDLRDLGVSRSPKPQVGRLIFTTTTLKLFPRHRSRSSSSGGN